MRKEFLFMFLLISAGSFLAAQASEPKQAPLKGENKIILGEEVGQVRMQSVMGTYGAKTAPAVPGENRSISWFATITPFLWHTNVTNTDYVYKDNVSNANVDSVFPRKAHNKFLHYNGDWGIEAGLGYVFAHDSWEIYGRYRFFAPSSSETTKASAGGSLTPLRAYSPITRVDIAHDTNTFDDCTRASIRQNLNIQDASIELRKPFFISRWFSLIPFFGVEGLWYEKHQRIRYSGGNPFGQVPAPNNGPGDGVVTVKDFSNFWGFGPRIGLNSVWYVCKNFNFISNYHFASLYGKFEVDTKQKFSEIPANKISFDYHFSDFAIDQLIQIGTSYENYLGKGEKYYLRIQLAYDAQYFISLDQALFLVSGGGVAPSDIRIIPTIFAQGGSLEFRLDF